MTSGSDVTPGGPDEVTSGSDTVSPVADATVGGSDHDSRLVLLHGFTGSAESWDGPVLRGIGARGADVVAIDLPGHGSRSGEDDPKRFSLDATLARIDDAIGPRVRSYDLVGYSMGGRIALHHALRRPPRLRRLILESASPGLETEEERARRRADDEALARRIVGEGMDAFVDRWEDLPLFASQRRLPEDVRRRHRARRLDNDPRSLAAALRGLGTGALPSLWSRLGEIGCPTLLVAGDLDRKFVEIARRMAQAMPEARLAIVRGAGHTVHLERPAEWLRLVSDFLAG